MSDQRELLDQIEYLRTEVKQLTARVAALEAEKVEKISTPKTLPTEVVLSDKTETKRQGASPLKKITLNKESLEHAIGGKLLNRVGIVVLLFAMAYFLKYSFDNQWIGELGRVVIGYIGGLGLLLAGDIVMRRQYRYFSQGFTGGGIGIIYLTTFAAANFYHLIGSGVAFGLLVLTALAGGLLAVRQQAFGVAILATVGGFLTPFLIGSKEANPVALLGYVTVLDLAVLYLAYFKQWRSLKLLAFVGTVLVYIVSANASYQPEMTALWINQGFLTVYFIIFGTLVFLHNIKHRQPTGGWDIVLLVLNAAFYFGASAANVDSHYGDWLGLFAVLLAVLYLVVALTLQKRKHGDELLLLALLGTGLAFVTLAIPLQLEKEEVIAAAWLVEAIILIYSGMRAKNVWVCRAGIVLLGFVALSLHLDGTPYFQETPLPLINTYSLAANLSVVGFFLVAYLFYYEPDLAEDERKKVWPAAVIGTLLALKQITWEVENAIHYFKLAYSIDFSVSLAWVALAVLLMVLGMTRNIKGLRLLALALFCLTTLKVMLHDLSDLAMLFRVLILFIVGAILVTVSFVYQRRGKGDEA
ncbi:DUF2339 domain-containing protein [Desulforamulus aeronauticus]|uniref:Predicted membrane protein n=1 Tax=Desulforamulus aeronauticus DSM 10349 TaxID=1121421 RepID=A0A1M6QY63_9FIRM|nr:DUF2339 domain-containing protein [Desulforamulus aeronauticus]SHK25165.1 Predicted membrane protein [Desulforamulus aeronauticus DSM 10349]